MTAMSSGSPPHTRGIQIDEATCEHRFRFTPAYAGNTSPDAPKPARRKVHPRIRGEYRLTEDTVMTGIGSPPHTRGIPEIERVETAMRGFTPAYAGNTTVPFWQSSGKKVHPRIRGEYKKGGL